jgi:hypothetical protein
MESVDTELRSGVRKRHLRMLIALAVATVALLSLGAAQARAASSYFVIECYPGAGVTYAQDVAISYDGGGGTVSGGPNCDPTGGDDKFWHKGILFHAEFFHPGPIGEQAQFDAPPGTYFASGNLRWEVGARNTSCDPANCWYAGIALGNGSGSVAQIASMAGTPTAGGYTWPASLCGSSCTRIWEAMSCVNFCWHDASSQPNGDWYYDYVAIRDLNVTLVDSSAPTLSLSGSVFDSQVTHGQPNLRIDSTDVGGGVRTATVEVNGTQLSAPAANCPFIAAGASFATAFRPCRGLAAQIELDTTRSPWRDGQNTLRVCAADVNTGPGAGNTTCQGRTIVVDNTCPDSQGASGQATGISAGLEDPKTGKLAGARAVRSNEGTPLTGQLAAGDGAPVKAASVCIYETVDEPAGIEQLVQVAKSNSTGVFRIQVPAGPSRSFRAAYRYNHRQLESGDMYLDSSVLPTLDLSKSKLRNGRPVGFRGHLPGPDNGGRGVTMQARVGKKWRSFKQLVTDSHGDFSGKYRFTQTRGRVRYIFRALVKKQSGYPYSEGASGTRKVLVTG